MKNTKDNETKIDSNLIPRPPIVVVMGHIDHGKSKLLDYIRNTNVVEKEAGGITQHIGAYEAKVKCDISHEHKTRKITFLDTPGHEAFSQMRIRGAKVADVAILVIAADEGIKPQALEAYEAIKKANVPFVVALNKIDKPNADPERAKRQLAENQIFVEGYGGKTPAVNISAKTGQGVDELLDIVLLLAEMENLKANPEQNASGFVIESRLGQRRGISATLLIQNGTLKKGMFVVSGNALAPVRFLEDFQSKLLEEATFSSPVRVFGFDNLPEVGAEFKSFYSKKEAEEVMASFPPAAISAREKLKQAEEEKFIVPIILKTDVFGSLEALEKETLKMQSENVIINIIRKGVGNISEEDVKIASSAKDAIILGFNIKIDAPIKNLAERFGIVIYLSNIIYEISEWLEKEIEKRKKQIITEKVIGKAKILKIFSKAKNQQVLGGEILEGKVAINNTYVKIKRNLIEIGEGKIKELQHNRMPVKEIAQGEQFGIMIESKIEIAKGDLIEIVEKL